MNRGALYPEDQFTNVFLGLPADANERGGPMLELTYNYGVAEYDIPIAGKRGVFPMSA